ncbi:MAG: DUF302 domain-containing protein [Aquificota bacterium]|jgi:uncharacterized protein (DUF302 family)|nr:MAG: DUF302 domain-containing protein [Aquificota bacterium]HAV40754.1 hypothetical protein [Aquificaceae bacterium]HCO38451.1 hypothetical protein [Aquificaceae bacterium]
MLMTYETTKSVEEVRKAIEEKAKANGFGVMSVHEVSNILESKGVPISYKCVIVEVCSPRHASQVLSKDPYISTAMPCRIAIFEENGKTVVSTMAPTTMLELFKRPELEEIAKEVEELMKKIMEESL